MPTMHLDLETRGVVDLRKAGVYRYAEDPLTDVWCACYAIDDEHSQVWTPGEPIPDDLAFHVAMGYPIYAHNAQFERIMWREVLASRHGFPDADAGQFFCTAAMAAVAALPRDLDGAAKAAAMALRKDKDGHNLMMRMARPRQWVTKDGKKVKPHECVDGVWRDADGNEATPVWWEDEEKIKRLIQYCIQDVEVERALEQKLRPLSESERQVYLMDAGVNDVGVRVDLDAVNAALDVIAQEKKRLDGEMARVTRGKVGTASQVAKLIAWLGENGVETKSVDKASVDELLSLDNLSDPVRNVLEIRKEAAKASTAKLQAMKNAVCSDGRARGLFLYYGAQATGRFSGRLIQLQNIPRGGDVLKGKEQINEAFDVLKKTKSADAIREKFGPPMTVISDMLRGFLVPAEGKKFYVCDFSSIEARVLALLAGEDEVVKIYLTGDDAYKHAAASIFHVKYEDVTKDQRSIGKVAVLALGYQGGANAFAKMARNYGLDLPADEADGIKTKWRGGRKPTVNFWAGVERVSTKAVQHPDRNFSYRDIKFKRKGTTLYLRLPSGRTLTYPDVRYQDEDMPWGGTRTVWSYMTLNSMTRKWERVSAYGGLITENIVQAVSRDLLVEAMRRLEDLGRKVVMHVHDEVVLEEAEGAITVDELEKIMGILPQWAIDIGWPEGIIAAEGEGPLDRYKK